MPIDIDRYENLAGEILQVYDEAERVMMSRVARRLQRGVDQPGWTERKYGEVQDVVREMRGFMSGFSADRREMQREFIEQAYADARNAMMDDARAFTQATGIAGLTPNTEKVARIMSELDLSMNAADRQILRSVNDAYANIVGQASALTATGTITYRDAVKRELEQFANRGITSFVDKAGRSWDMETYAEMATLTAIERASREGYIDAAQEFGYDLMMISDHYGACPICEAWQNVVVSVSGNTPGYPSLSEAESAGVFHPRCMHDLSVYHEGVSTGGKTAPEAVREPNPGYTARSQQRYYERQERLWKRRMAVASTPEEERMAYARVRMYQQKLRELVNGYNVDTDRSVDHLPRKYWRGGGRTKLSADAKKLRPVKLSDNSHLTNGSNSDIIKREDIMVLRSLGAKSIVSPDEEIDVPNSKYSAFFVPGERIRNVQVFAGKGTKDPIRERFGLANYYKGTDPNEWEKVKGIAHIIHQGEEHIAEVHWYHEDSIGGVEYKVKRQEDGRLWLDER